MSAFVIESLDGNATLHFNRPPSRQVLCSFVNKSQAAFLMSCDRLFEQWPRPYFWTFTFTKVWSDWFYPASWAAFIRDLQNVHGGLVCGVRVIEPGEEHGLHYHAILNMRISVHIVRRLAKRYDIGRVQVQRCDYGAALYLSQYLGKQVRLFGGIHKWGCVGGFRGVRVRDVEIDSIAASNQRFFFGGVQVPFAIATQCFRFSRLYGHLRDWPQEVSSYVLALAMYFRQEERHIRKGVCKWMLELQAKVPERFLKSAGYRLRSVRGREYALTTRTMYRAKPKLENVLIEDIMRGWPAARSAAGQP